MQGLDASDRRPRLRATCAACVVLFGCVNGAVQRASRDVAPDGPSTRLTRADVDGAPAMTAPLPLGAREDDSGHFRSSTEECRPYTDELLEISGYADDFPVVGPDVALTWRPETAGTYVVELEQIGGEGSSFSVLRGACNGAEVAPITGMADAWPGFAFAAVPDEEYTFVIEGEQEVTSVELYVDMGCESVDGASCVREDERGNPECGVRYLVDESTDDVSCEPLHAPGAIDARCPDTTWRGEQVEGCCKPSGVCGHFDEQLGCHDLAQAEGAPQIECTPTVD